jgi:ATP-dependent DNA helicase RecQ
MPIDYSHRYQDAERLLKKHWGFDSFRQGQDTVVKSVLKGSDTLVLFPTGGGKSLCYQVPALVLDGLTLVISPLVALMEDQVSQLRRYGISAEFINSTISRYEVEQRVINARNGMYRLLYVAPERLHTSLFQHELPDLNIELVAVDEAHCISEWGHEFRPSYRQIRDWIEATGINPRWMALTATATPKVREDIIGSLNFKEPVVVTKTFERSNLKWWVIPTHQKRSKLKQLLARAEGSGLIYAGTRRECEQLAESITGTGLKAAAYHAGLSADLRKKIQTDWIKDDIPLVVATNAFGMGIDKPDCRYVVHWSVPGSIEAYYQEAGRAGRDGLPSFPVLLYSQSDLDRLKKQIDQSHPGLDVLHKVYSAICDSLDLALGTIHETARVVDPVSISKRSGVPLKVMMHVIRALDRYGVIALTDDYPPAVGILFHTELDQICNPTQGRNHAKDAFGDKLGRLYSSDALVDMHFIDMDVVCDRMSLSRNAIIKGLEVFRLDGLLAYEIRDGKPLIELLEPRQGKVPVSRETVEQYRRHLMVKVDFMEGYALTNQCRSAYLRRYFGETEVPSTCGNCDICLATISAEEKHDLGEDAKTVLKLLQGGSMSVTDLQSALKWRKDRLSRSLKWLGSEGLIMQQGDRLMTETL